VPGKTLGIVAFILSFFIQLVALILGIVALVQSRKAGHKNGWAVAAIIISAVLMILGIILFFAIVLPLLTFSGEVLQACQAVDFSGTVEVRGLPVDCSSVSN
jgi:Ca2+/Na+ antiporter